MSILNVENLSHGFGDRAIFNQVSFRLLKGEHIGLIGPNGEGKSTFMNIVTDRLMPDEGKVEWAKNVRIGYLDQHAVLQQGMTVRDVLTSAFDFLLEIESRIGFLYEKMAEDSPEEVEKSLEEVGDLAELKWQLFRKPIPVLGVPGRMVCRVHDPLTSDPLLGLGLGIFDDHGLVVCE